MSSATPWPFDGPRQRATPLEVSQEARPDWSRRGRWLRRANGDRIEVHPIGSLAQALGKSSFTIRRWEREGILPPTPLVLAVAGGAPRRLYSTQQIEAVTLVATQEGVAHRKPAELGLTNFTPRVRSVYEQLFPEYFKQDGRTTPAPGA